MKDMLSVMPLPSYGCKMIDQSEFLSSLDESLAALVCCHLISRIITKNQFLAYMIQLRLCYVREMFSGDRSFKHLVLSFYFVRVFTFVVFSQVYRDD